MLNESSEAIESYCRNICLNEKIKLFVRLFYFVGKILFTKYQSVCFVKTSHIVL